MSDELFNVVQFFTDDTHEYVRRNVPTKEACEAFAHYTRSVGARMGMVSRVIITDDGDMTCAEVRSADVAAISGGTASITYVSANQAMAIDVVKLIAHDAPADVIVKVVERILR